MVDESFMVTRKTLSCRFIVSYRPQLRTVFLCRSTYRLAAVRVQEARVEGAVGAVLQRRAGILVAAGDDAVVLGLEVELQNVALARVDGVRVELVVARGRDGDGLGAGESGESDHGEDVLERRHRVGSLVVDFAGGIGRMSSKQAVLREVEEMAELDKDAQRGDGGLKK